MYTLSVLFVPCTTVITAQKLTYYFICSCHTLKAYSGAQVSETIILARSSESASRHIIPVWWQVQYCSNNLEYNIPHCTFGARGMLKVQVFVHLRYTRA